MTNIWQLLFYNIPKKSLARPLVRFMYGAYKIQSTSLHYKKKGNHGNFLFSMVKLI